MLDFEPVSSHCLFQTSTAPALPGRSFQEKLPIEFEDEPRMNTNRWTSFAATTSRNAAHPGARASRPHKSWHSLAICSTRVDGNGAGAPLGHAVPAGRVDGCPIAGKPSATERWCMRAGRPRSRVGASSNRSCSSRVHTPACRSADRVDAAQLSRFAALRGPSCHFVDHSFFLLFQTSTAPALQADHSRVKQRVFIA